MKIAKVIVILALSYAGIVVLFESLIGYFQPAGQTTLVITTTDENGSTNDRVISRLESNGELFIAANHWPRAWYKQVLKIPEVQVTLDGTKADYLAVPTTDEEHNRVDSENELGFVVRFLTGFPPRYIVRLEPVKIDH